MLDEVAWLYNLRGSDIDFNPVFFAYSVVTQDKAILFINPSQVNDAVRNHLGDGVELQPYDEFFHYISELRAVLELSKQSVRLYAVALSLLVLTLYLQQALLGDKTSLAIAEAIGNVRVNMQSIQRGLVG